MEALKQKLISLYIQLIAWYKGELEKQIIIEANPPVTTTPKTMGQIIYEVATKYIGVDASPSDLAPDELGCAESVSNILIEAGCDLAVCLSTNRLYHVLSESSFWKPATDPQKGDVILAVTGQGGKNGVTNGHVGIIGKGTTIMSNNSATGKWDTHLNLATWDSRYTQLGGYPKYIFRRI